MRALVAVATLLFASLAWASPATAATAGPPTIAAGEPVTLKVNPKAKQRFFKIHLPPDAMGLSVSLSGVDCTRCPLNADLYIRAEALPTNNAYDCRSSNPGSHEWCSGGIHTPRDWYIRVKWISGAGRVQLFATYAIP